MRRLLLSAVVVQAVFALVGCTTYTPPEVPVAPPDGAATPVDWDAVFAAPAPIQVVPLLTAIGPSPRDFLLNVDDDRIADKDDDDLEVPVLAYLVRHPAHGDLLLDSGFDHTFTEDGSGNLGGLAALIDWVEQRPGQDTVSQLRALGVDPAGLERVVISHLHPDHTAGLPDIPKHVPVYAGPEATRSYGVGFYAPLNHFDGFEQVYTYDFQGVSDSGPGPALDVFGDGSVWVISTPGHVHGNLSFLLNGPGGPVLLLCDACHLQEGWRARVRPGGVIDEEVAQQTLDRLTAWADRHPQLRVIAGHDPVDWDMTRATQDPLFED